MLIDDGGEQASCELSNGTGFVRVRAIWSALWAIKEAKNRERLEVSK
jgi:hypothetical protein